MPPLFACTHLLKTLHTVGRAGVDLTVLPIAKQTDIWLPTKWSVLRMDGVVEGRKSILRAVIRNYPVLSGRRRNNVWVGYANYFVQNTIFVCHVQVQTKHFH